MSSKKTPPPIHTQGLEDLCPCQVLVESIPFNSSLITPLAGFLLSLIYGSLIFDYAALASGDR